MGLLNKAIIDYGDTNNVFSNTPEGKSLQQKEDRKRSSSTLYLLVASFIGSVVFIICWIYAYLAWGFWPGVCLGWIPALFVGVVAGLVWPMVIFIIVVYMLFLRFRGMI